MSLAEELLLAWARWWLHDDHTPVKLPDALHVRTGVYFCTRRFTPNPY